ncbi:unannotated protein [freshwater metagenome]|uniref:Unannotated protein n=1 Tax=freshwater metagenome TaxID=449393 RepID=A0A6J6L797_9ZZZZ
MWMQQAGQSARLTPVTSKDFVYLGGYIGNIQFEESKKRFTQSLRGGPDDTSTA